MGAKSFIGTPEMQIIFVLKDKLICTMKKCMVSMATVNFILKHPWGCTYKIGPISTVDYPRPLNLIMLKLKTLPFHPMGSSVLSNLPIYHFMKTLKMTKIVKNP